MNLQTVSFAGFNLMRLENTHTFPPKENKSDKKNIKIPLSEKFEIVNRIKNGEQQSMLAKEYNVTKSTMARIWKFRNEIEQFWIENKHRGDIINKKHIIRLKKDEPLLDACVEIWYLQNYYSGTFVSGRMLQEKALEFNVKLGGPLSFKASNGWLHKFKARCGIKLTPTQDEKSSLNSETAFEFRKKFSQALRNDKFSMENIYNAEENILWWKTFPKKTEYEKNAPKITLVICANATGTHKVPMMIIGRSKIPRTLNNAQDLPINYKAQESSWMDVRVFKSWLREIFVPSVKSRQQKDGKKGGVVLLLDSAASRYISDTSISSCGILIKIVFLPMNLTSSVLPMNQGVIEKVKMIYRQNFLIGVLQRGNSDDAETVKELLKTWNLKDSCYILKSAWESISPVILAQAWRAVCEQIVDMFPKKMETENVLYEKPQVLNLLKKIPGLENCSENDANSWLANDINEEDEGLEDDENVTAVNTEENESVHESQDVDVKMSENENKVSTKDAIASLEKVLKWIVQQKDFKEDVFHISNLRDRMNAQM